jgi:hypothetical protein
MAKEKVKIYFTLFFTIRGVASRIFFPIYTKNLNKNYQILWLIILFYNNKIICDNGKGKSSTFFTSNVNLITVKQKK